jgi:hypothetical protein
MSVAVLSMKTCMGPQSSLLDNHRSRSSTLQVGTRHLQAGDAKHRVSKRASDTDLLEAYLDFVRSMRNSDGVVSLRDDDLEVLSQVLGCTVLAVRTNLEDRMVQVARREKRGQVTRRVAFAAFGVAIVGSALVLASQTKSSQSDSRLTAARVEIGSALTIERLPDGALVESEDGSTVSATPSVRIGGAQTISR